MVNTLSHYPSYAFSVTAEKKLVGHQNRGSITAKLNCPLSNNRSNRTMGRPKRNILAAATESTTPPDELTEHQFVARVGKPEGNNTYTCILPSTKTTLVELAQRFRNTIWIKRGGYVVVDLTPSEERSKTNNNKVVGEIINVVRDEKEWRKMPYWYDSLRHCCFQVLFHKLVKDAVVFHS